MTFRKKIRKIWTGAIKLWKVSVFGKLFRTSSPSGNEDIVNIKPALDHESENINWHSFDHARTIGTKGSEGGKIIYDIENVNGARITLEKECGNIPFAVTIGIYGLMFHTHFDSDYESAISFIGISELRINKVFELYKLREEERDDPWRRKHDLLMEELAEMTTS